MEVRHMEAARLLASVNATLRARHAAGLSVELVDCSGEVLRDGRVGLFVRLQFRFDDGGVFECDLFEPWDMLRALKAH
jgi:hypothetical protein